MKSEAPLPKWASRPCIMGIDEAGRGPVLGITSLSPPPRSLRFRIQPSSQVGIFCAARRAYGVRLLVLCSVLSEDSLHAQLRRFSASSLFHSELWFASSSRAVLFSECSRVSTGRTVAEIAESVLYGYLSCFYALQIQRHWKKGSGRNCSRILRPMNLLGGQLMS